jgi:hypothetical protein
LFAAKVPQLATAWVANYQNMLRVSIGTPARAERFQGTNLTKEAIMTFPNDDYNRPRPSYEYDGRESYVGVSVAAALVLALIVGFLIWNGGGPSSQQSANNNPPASTSSTTTPPSGPAPIGAPRPDSRPPLNSRPNG